MKLVQIVLPEKISNLSDYCNESEGIVGHCYGYWKAGCPKTCSYARDQESKQATETERYLFKTKSQ